MISMFSLIQLNQRFWVPKDTQDGFNLLEVIQCLFEPFCSVLEMHGEMRVCALSGFLKMLLRWFHKLCWKVSHSTGSGQGSIPICMIKNLRLRIVNPQNSEGLSTSLSCLLLSKICFDKVLHEIRLQKPICAHASCIFLSLSTRTKT